MTIQSNSTAFAASLPLSRAATEFTQSHPNFTTRQLSQIYVQSNNRLPKLRRSRFPSCSADIEEPAAYAAPKLLSLTWAVGHSSEYKVVNAVTEATARASATISREGVTVDVAVVFVKSRGENTPDDQMARVLPVLRKTLAMRRVLAEGTVVFGCSTASYLEGDDDSSVSVALAHFPEGTIIRPFAFSAEKPFDLDWNQKQWHEFTGVNPSPQGPSQATNAGDASKAPGGNLQLFLLQHPDFEQSLDLLSGLDFAYPGVRKFGAIAGRAHPLNTAYLFDSDGLRTNGVVGLAISSPDLQIDVRVAQGARGVGPMMEVVEVRNGNEICKVREVGTATQAQAAPMVLFDMWASTDLISPEDRELARRYLLFGVEVQKVVDIAVSSMSSDSKEKEKEEEKEKGKIPRSEPDVDMVINKVVGFNEVTKSVAVESSDIRLGSRVQFQIRDEEAARSELIHLFNKLMLEGSSKAMEGMSMMGALLLVDTERGANLYGNVTPDLDRALFTERFPVPLAMLSSEGQIGPLPAGGFFGTAGNTFALTASALYVSFYGRTALKSSPGSRETDDQP